MRLEDLALNLRPRSHWEAMDLGFALARAHGKPLFISYGLALLPFLVLSAVVATVFPFLAPAALWWFKPVWERVALHVLSQTAFGVVPTWGATLRGLRQIPRTGLLSQLLPWRRIFDWGRSFHSPVFQLETQKGKAARARFAALDKRIGGNATWLTFAFAHFSLVIWAGLVGLVFLLLPQDLQPGNWLNWIGDQGGAEEVAQQAWLNAAQAILAGVVMMLLEPFYVAAGFALYLTRRTQLEGWDVELAFKRMNARLAAQPGAESSTKSGTKSSAESVAPRTNAAAPLLLLLGVALGIAQLGAARPVAAQASQAATAAVKPAPQSRPVLDEVLKGKEFEQFEQQKNWKPRSEKKPETRDSPNFGWLESLAKLISSFAEIGRFLLWVAVIVLAAWLLYWLAKRFGWAGLFDRTVSAPKPETLFGLDIRPESLPDDVAAAARALLAKGDLRAALSLLYRGALSALVQRDALEVKAGYTEGDCAREVTALTPIVVSSYFGNLVAAWQRVAYAQSPPPSANVAALCDEWARHFAPNAAAPSPTTPA